ncbi:MAG: carbohydrate binding domain-containing protein [Armatimonadota bacterium]
MKWYMPIALVLAIMLLISIVSAQPLVPNAGFETGTGDKPDSWSWRADEGATGSFEWATAPVHGGQRSFRVARHGAGGFTALDSSYIPVEVGKTYRVSAWIFPQKPVRRGVYFMITQHTADSDADQLPNTFGTTTERFVARDWQQISVGVTIRDNITRIRIHCIQAMLPTDLYWDDFTVEEARPGAKPRYEAPVKETLPDLAPAQAIVAKRPRAQVRMEMVGARPRLFVDGKQTPFAWYVSAFGGPGFFSNTQIGDFAKAGVHVYLAPLILGNGLYGTKGPWLGKDQYDFSVVDDILWRVLRVDPQANVIFYMCCDPYPAWGAENSDHVTQDQNGLPAIVDMHTKRWGGQPAAGERFGPSLVSHKLRDDVAVTLRKLVAHVETSQAGKAVIGYHVAGFNDGQWFQWARLNPADLHLADYCPGAQEAFRDWLSHRYHTSPDGPIVLSEEAFQKAWNDPKVTSMTARVPGEDKLWADKVFVDPKTEQDVADYQRFYSEGVAENIMYLAGVLKKESKRRVLCGTYYEDITCNSANHIALGRFLNSPEIDYLAGPAAYGIRMAGYQGAVRNVFGSTCLHGKQYLTEQDWRSWHSVPNENPQNNFSWGRAETADIHNAMVRRECGMMLAFGLGTWWYDMSGGWFRDDQIMSAIAESVRAFKQELADKDSPRGDLAVFVSEESDSYIRMRYGGPYRYQGIVQQIEELNTAGVPYRLYLQSDLGKIRLPEHKAYLFLNPYLITPVQQKAIESLKRDGKLLAFVHSPGMIGGDDAARTASEITGIELKPLAQAAEVRELPKSSHPLTIGMDDSAIMVAAAPVGALAVTDAKATALTLYQDKPQVGCAARDFGKWKSVFIGSPGVSGDFLNNMAQWSGCWVAAPVGDAVYGSQHFLTIHALFPGHKTLRLPQRSKVTDLTSGKVIAESAQTVEVDMERGQTRWFRLQAR